MIISHKYKFIFIKTFKTAGTSIEVFLSQHCAASDVITRILPAVAAHKPRNFEQGGFYNHMLAKQVKATIASEIWDGYFKFCVERNPWDKLLSHYHMMSHRSTEKLSLVDYMEEGRFPLNFSFYTNDQGDLIVDEVLKYESLDADLSRVFNNLNIPFAGQLGVWAKSGFRSDRRHYKEVLSKQQVQFITERFQREIDMHGYVF